MVGRKQNNQPAPAPAVIKPPDPVVTRMPTEADPAVMAAQQRVQESAKKRSGRTSTILSDALRGITGSKGRLGA